MKGENDGRWEERRNQAGEGMRRKIDIESARGRQKMKGETVFS